MLLIVKVGCRLLPSSLMMEQVVISVMMSRRIPIGRGCCGKLVAVRV